MNPTEKSDRSDQTAFTAPEEKCTFMRKSERAQVLFVGKQISSSPRKPAGRTCSSSLAGHLPPEGLSEESFRRQKTGKYLYVCIMTYVWVSTH